MKRRNNIRMEINFHKINFFYQMINLSSLEEHSSPEPKFVISGSLESKETPQQRKNPRPEHQYDCKPGIKQVDLRSQLSF